MPRVAQSVAGPWPLSEGHKEEAQRHVWSECALRLKSPRATFSSQGWRDAAFAK